jgi:hypothetical protein
MKHIKIFETWQLKEIIIENLDGTGFSIYASHDFDTWMNILENARSEGWYVPTKEQMMKIREHAREHKDIPNRTYWTSEERDRSRAYGMNLYSNNKYFQFVDKSDMLCGLYVIRDLEEYEISSMKYNL